MRSDGNQNCVPKVPAAQFTLDQARKYLLKLRWIGKELEAQTILEALDDARLQPPLPGDRRKRTHSHWAVSQETSPVHAGLAACFVDAYASCTVADPAASSTGRIRR
jgi:hypothetical protein